MYYNSYIHLDLGKVLDRRKTYKLMYFVESSGSMLNLNLDLLMV